MALKAVLKKDEYAGLAETLKTLYKADGDGYVLDLDGTEEHPSVRALNSALASERSNRSAKEREIAELRAKMGDLDPEEARKALARVKELETSIKEGDIPEKFKKQFDEAVEHRVQSMRADFDNKERAYKKQLDEANASNGTLTSKLEELMIDNEVRSAAAKAGLNDWAIEDAVMHARSIYHVKDGKPVPIKPGTKDEIIYGKDPSQPKPIAEWLSDKVAEKPGWVKQSTGGGAENNGRPGSGSGQFRLTREQARDTSLYRRTKELAEKAGQQVQIEG